MENIKFVVPSILYKESFNNMIKDYDRVNEEFSKNTEFKIYYKYLGIKERGELPGYEGVKQYEYWLMDKNDSIIGTARIRNKLNDKLKVNFGNLGYDIAPSFRRKGYGKLILKLALEKAKLGGLKKILLTVSEDNTISEKIIVANGGVYEGSSYVDDMKKVMKRYCIDLREENK